MLNSWLLKNQKSKCKTENKNLKHRKLINKLQLTLQLQ